MKREDRTGEEAGSLAPEGRRTWHPTRAIWSGSESARSAPLPAAGGVGTRIRREGGSLAAARDQAPPYTLHPWMALVPHRHAALSTGKRTSSHRPHGDSIKELPYQLCAHFQMGTLRPKQVKGLT